MNFIRHIGKHGDRKIAILYRQVPGEDHMCLVVQPDILPATKTSIELTFSASILSADCKSLTASHNTFNHQPPRKPLTDMAMLKIV